VCFYGVQQSAVRRSLIDQTISDAKMKSSRTNFGIQQRRPENRKQANMLRARPWRSGVDPVEKIESAICVAILAEMAMLRKNQRMVDGKVAKGMWQSWEMIELKSARRREISARKRIEKCKLQNEKCKLVDGSSIG
jgi:hypothetical protein